MRINWKSLMLYGGLTPDMFRIVTPDANESNRTNLLLFSILVAAAMFVMAAVSFFSPSLEKIRPMYAITSAICLVIALATGMICPKRSRTVKPFMYFFLLTMLWFGVMLCTVVEPNEVAVSLVILLFAIPLLFTDRPINMCLLLASGVGMYLFVEYLTLNTLAEAERALQVREYNLTNIIPYSCLSAIVSTYMMQIKYERMAYIEKNKLLIETDQMTGLLNRRSYSIKLEKLAEKGPKAAVTVCSIDVNGLKTANDNLGHSAGDELICGAAQCIRDILGKYGDCYRTGGDEFVVIFDSLPNYVSSDDLKKQLQKRCSEWRGKIVKGVSLSVGIVQNTDLLGIDDLIAKADAAMYTDKARHYAESGQKRR